MVFDYYRRLSMRDRRTYRQSDEIVDVPLPNPAATRAAVADLASALERGERRDVEHAAERICRSVTRQLEAPAVEVRVLAKRPKRADGELHGLYTLDDNGRAFIEVWMKTAEHRRVVAFRTFLRTLLHELCHHLDLTHLGLEETFHTEGFFRRESSLFRQLVPKRAPSAPRHAERTQVEPKPEPDPRAKPERSEPRPPAQLSLFSER